MTLKFEIKEQNPRKKPWRIVLVVFLGLVLIAILGAGYFYWESQNMLREFSAGDKERIVSSAEEELGVSPKNYSKKLARAQTFLLIGADRRYGTEERWGRSDTIVLARVYPKEKIVSLLSIPRDLYVDIPGSGMGKINEAYSKGGPAKLIATIRNFLGVRVDHYFQIDFAGFAEFVDEIGGVFLPVDQRYFHSNEGLSEAEQYSEIDLEHGYQRLGGADALSFVRFRHGDTDFLRAARQQLFLREVSRQTREMAEGDVFALRDLARAFSRSAASDFDSFSDALRLGRTLRSIPSSRITRQTLYGASTDIGGVFYLLPDEANIDELLYLWSNPKELLQNQRYKKRSTKSAENLLLFTNWLEEMTDLAPGMSLAGNNWIDKWRPKKYTRPPFKKLQKRLQDLQTRKFDDSGRAKDGDTLLDPEAILVPLPSEEVSYPGLTTCTPTYLPPGYSWSYEGIKARDLKNNLTLSLYATRSSGYSLLWNWSRWKEAPILQNPDDAIRVDGRTYSLYWESGALRSVAWQKNDTVAWVTNTLGNELDPQMMIALARTCVY